MKRQPKIGEAAEIRFTVAPEHAIEFHEEGMPAVLSTPWLIWFLEHAARKALAPIRETTESCVGVHIDLEHLAPTPIGSDVVCTARIIHGEGKVVSFQLQAFEGPELIARGVHKRRVIRIDRFAARVRSKVGSTSQ